MNDQAQYGKLHQAIRSKISTLTPTERRIASYILEQTTDVAMTSVQEMAARLETGPATIMRVVRKLGYHGLSALKREIRQSMRRNGSPLIHFKTTLDHGLESGLEEIRLIAEREVQNIQETLTLLNKEGFAEAARLIKRAQHVNAVGIGISAHLAATTAFMLRKIGVKADAIPHTGLPVTESIIPLNKGDLLVAFSFPPYSPQTIEAVTLARTQGVSVIGITNQPLAPIAEHCDVVLVAKTESRIPSNSLTAPLMLVSGLVSLVAAKTRPLSLKALETAINLRKKKPR